MTNWQRTVAIYLAYRIARQHRDTPASPAAVGQAEQFCRTSTGTGLPAELFGLWQVVSGMDFNGTVLFAPREQAGPDSVAGLVETNEALLAHPPYLHVGSFGDEFLSWNCATTTYALIDKISQDPVEAYRTFDDLIEEHFGRHLSKWASNRAPELLEG